MEGREVQEMMETVMAVQQTHIWNAETTNVSVSKDQGEMNVNPLKIVAQSSTANVGMLNVYRFLDQEKTNVDLTRTAHSTEVHSTVPVAINSVFKLREMDEVSASTVTIVRQPNLTLNVAINSVSKSMVQAQTNASMTMTVALFHSPAVMAY